MRVLFDNFGKTLVAAAMPLAIMTLASCDEDLMKLKDESKGAYVQTEDKPIASTLEDYEEFSEWVNVLNYSETYSVLNARNGSASAHTFTLFAPTNEAMQRFYQKRGVSRVEELGVTYAAALVKTMTTDVDSLKLTELFSADVVVYNREGKLVNEAGENIYLSVDSIDGFDLWSKSSADTVGISREYIKCSNGFIYKADGALAPLVETVFDRVVANGASHIMVEALRATGYDKVLSTVADTTYVLGAQRITNYYYTLLNVSDEAFGRAGIGSLADLKNALAAHDDDPSATTDELLKRYVEYHLFDASYSLGELQEMIGTDTVRIWQPIANDQIMMISQSAAYVSQPAGEGGETALDTIYTYFLNVDDIEGQSIDDASSNVMAKNGYVHELTGWLPVYMPKQSTVVWDLADYSEIRNACQKEGYVFQPAEAVANESKLSVSSAKCYTVETGPEDSKNSSYGSLTYVTCKSNLKDCLNHDRLVFNMGYMGYVSMKTPTLVKGKYKVSIKMAYLVEQAFIRNCNGSKGGMMRIWVDLPEPAYKPADDEWETYHKLDCAPYTTITKSTPGVYETVLYDEIEFTETASHTFKFIMMDPAASTNAKFSLQFDAITFTPITE